MSWFTKVLGFELILWKRFFWADLRFQNIFSPIFLHMFLLPVLSLKEIQFRLFLKSRLYITCPLKNPLKTHK